MLPRHSGGRSHPGDGNTANDAGCSAVAQVMPHFRTGATGGASRQSWTVAAGLLWIRAVGVISTVSTPRPHDRTRVLVVESDPVQRTMVADWLGAMPGVTVVAVASAGQAMACDRPQGFHLCVLRQDLGGVDGLTLGAMLRRLNAEARLVLLGSGACPHLVSLAREHGFTAVVDGALVREQVEGWVR